MARWMMKFEVEGHLGVEGQDRTLVFRHQGGQYEVHVQNCDMAHGIEKPLLSVFVVFNADDIGVAATTGPKHLDRFLQFLSFATGSRFQLSRRVCLYDWSPDELSMRQGYVYQYFSDPNIPQLVMDDRVISTVETLLQSDNTNADIMQALNWFSASVSASGAGEQFQLF